MSMQITQSPLKSRPIGEIAADLPGATAIFRKFKLDFCCSGDVALADAAKSRGVNLEAVEHELEELSASGQSVAIPHETPVLIDHILERYHETHRRELPELVELARKVEKVHAEHPQAPHGLGDLLQQIIGELEVHMKKEELILFPAMRRQPTGVFDAPISQMRHDHDDHGAHLQKLETITNGLELPDGACRSWQALYAGTGKFIDDLMEHVHLENNVLFPRFETKFAQPVES